MIDRENGELYAACNECGEVLWGGTMEWKEFVQHIKDENWKIKKVDGEWEHRCPSCQN